ncbi:MAG TPA: 30S ribosomal protein S7 [Candidatus Paceibacterota bacterium]|nr:30S ribosomal protein S7 [Candidatus Paceibacterota bacterium]
MRRAVKNRAVLQPDRVYNSVKVTKLINYVMDGGKKTIAEGIVYSAFDKIKEQEKKDPLEVFETVLTNISPVMEVRSRRVGGANYQVPMEVRPERRLSLALRWILESARSKKGRPMKDRLADEMLLAYKNEGDAVKKRENVHKMAEANKAFAHFSW